MTEAVAAAKTKSNRIAFASILLVVLLVAFGVAFYALGGADLLPNVLSGVLMVTAPASHTASPAPSAAATSSASAETSATLRLPAGVDEPFAKRMYVEQLESQANIAKLVAGQVSGFRLGAAALKPDGTELAITAKFRDGTSAGGTLGLAKRGDDWYFVFITAKRDSATTGTAESFAGNEGPLEAKPVDIDVLNTVLEQQEKSQPVLRGFIDGTYTAIDIDRVLPGAGTATLEVTLSGPKTTAIKGRVLCISKDIDGTKTWFITSFTTS